MTLDVPPPVRYRRRWFQYSLRSLMLLTMAVLLATSALTVWRNGIRREHAAAMRLREQGVGVYWDEPGRLRRILGEDYGPVEELRLNVYPVDLSLLEEMTYVREVRFSSDCAWEYSDDSLSHVAAMPSLEKLDLHGAGIFGPGLVHLQEMPKLRSLSLAGTQVDDEALALVGECRGLEELCLSSTRITSAGLAHLKGLSRLRMLKIANTEVGDRGAERIAAMDGLEELDIANTRITDDGLAQVCKLTGLKKLWLLDARITDAGLAHLEDLKEVAVLEVNADLLTPEALEHLKALPKLKELYPNSPGYGTSQGRKAIVAELQQALPTCTINKQ